MGRSGQGLSEDLGRSGLPPIGRLGASLSEDLGSWYRKTWGVYGRGIGRLGVLVSEDLGSSIGRLGEFAGATCVPDALRPPAPRPLLLIIKLFKIKDFKIN